MSRQVNGVAIDLLKNFHDEKEWRFIPEKKKLDKVKFPKVHFNQEIINNCNDISDNIEDEEYESLWLKYDYEDIKYLIVPNNTERKKLIDYILKIPSDNFTDEFQKYILISKIQVLNDIRKDC